MTSVFQVLYILHYILGIRIENQIVARDRSFNESVTFVKLLFPKKYFSSFKIHFLLFFYLYPWFPVYSNSTWGTELIKTYYNFINNTHRVYENISLLYIRYYVQIINLIPEKNSNRITINSPGWWMINKV